MYCSNCGAKAEGSFCSSCGKPLEKSDGSSGALFSDWSNEVRYDFLLKIPEVRSKVASYTNHDAKVITGEEFLKLCDSVPLGLPISKVITAAYPILAKSRVRTGKSRVEHLSSPPGKTLVATLCALSLRGLSLRHVHQEEDGCVLEAVLPSDVWSLEGDLVVAVRRGGVGALVEASTKIKGQMFDWGKSRRCLDMFFSDLLEIIGGGGSHNPLVRADG
ncbi:MAG: hypothetical protein ABIS20_03360 [Thermoanaerobaculia bacterium]